MSCCSEELVVLEDGTLVSDDVSILSFDGGIIATQDPANPALVHIALGGPGAVSLQLAYDGGETILTDGQGQVEINRGMGHPVGEPNLLISSATSGPNILEMIGAPRIGPGFFQALVSDTGGWYGNGRISTDGGDPPGAIWLVDPDEDFMIGAYSDIGDADKHSIYLGVSSDADLAFVRYRQAADTRERLRIDSSGKVSWGSGGPAPDISLERTSATGLKLASTSAGAGFELPDSLSPDTGNIRWTNDPDLTIYRHAANQIGVYANVLHIRSGADDPALQLEKAAGTLVFLIGISGGTQTALIDNLSGLKYITLSNPGAGTLAHQFSDAGGVLFQIDGDGDCVVTQDIEAAGGYRQTVGIWTTALVANQTDVAATRTGTTTNDYLCGRAGSITGIRTRTDAAVTAGTLTINVRVGGVIVFTSAITATSTVTNQAKDLDAIASGNLITVSYTTSAAFAGPTVANVEVEIEQ